jgi:hypothetical protein
MLTTPRQPKAVPSPLPLSVPLFIDNPHPSTSPQPVTAGVPFPRGALAGAGAVRLCDAEGREVPVQALPLARWPDGSVRWLLLDFLLPAGPAGRTAWSLRPAGGGPVSGGVRVDETPQGTVVCTGAATFLLGGPGRAPLAGARAGGVDLLGPGGLAVVLTDAKGGRGAPRVERVVVEDRGPVRATVRFEGAFTGRVRCRFVARLCFFAGTGLVRLRLTVHNPNRARHKGGLWDLGDPGSLLFRDLSLELGLPPREGARGAWAPEAGQPFCPLQPGGLEIYQGSSGGENWASRNHVNRFGEVPCAFRGYRVREAGREAFGRRASPVVAVAAGPGTLTAAVPEFWQQFPKAVEADGGRLALRLFPAQFGDLFELQGGEQKTHTAWLHFGTGEPDGAPLAWAHRPARLHAAPEWYAGSRAVPFLGPLAADRHDLEGLLTSAVGGANSFFARREVIDEYGWRHYGEVYADHEAAHYAGAAPVVSHYNNQYDVVCGTLLQYLRTGDGRWFDVLAPLARHVIDIDIYHTERDRPAYSSGLFWHTDHYRDAATCTHRGYSRANRRPGDRAYGGGPSDEHNYTTGLLHYYYLTGDPLARDAVLGLADWVVRADDGALTLLGAFDAGPTGRASATRDRDYHGPGRGCGNSVNALLDAWLASGRRAYLEKAEALIRRCVHPHDDVAARDLLNLEDRWSYTVFLAVLARYLALKAEAGETDFMYAYGRAVLLRYAEWMLEHEAPYLDRADRLEYPTETWAAQDLRKANVLRLAACHAEPALRERLRRRADELAERAWSDLDRFPSRTVTRALALLMTEGLRDHYCRAAALPAAPAPAGDYNFGSPEVFLTQRRRVLARLKTPRGLAAALLKLADPRNWPRLWRHRAL